MQLPFSEGMIKVYKEVKCLLCCSTSVYVKHANMDMSWSNSVLDRLVTVSKFTVRTWTIILPSYNELFLQQRISLNVF